MITLNYPLGGLKYVNDAEFQTLWPEFQAFADSFGFRQALHFEPHIQLAMIRSQREKLKTGKSIMPGRVHSRGHWRLYHTTPQLLTHANKDLTDPQALDGYYGPYGSCISHAELPAVFGFSKPLHRDGWELTMTTCEDMGFTPLQAAAWEVLLAALLATPRYDFRQLPRAPAKPLPDEVESKEPAESL